MKFGFASSMWRCALGLAIVLLAVGCASTVSSPKNCINGAYLSTENEIIVISNAQGTPRYRNISTGRAGLLFRIRRGGWALSTNISDPLPGGMWVNFDNQCQQLSVTPFHSLVRKKSISATRIPLHVTETRFVSEDGTELAGRFVTPAGNGPYDYVVLVHGSSKESGLQTFYHQYGFPAQGIAAFVYDKRGTGQSEGEFTSDFHLLAADASAALQHVRDFAPLPPIHVGYSGYSQGGWVAPLAAKKNQNTDFIIVNYGMVSSPLYEDKYQALCELKQKGFTPTDLQQAGEFIDALHQVLVSGFTDGYEPLAQLRDKYQRAKWMPAFNGEFSGEIRDWPNWVLRILGPIVDDSTTPFEYNSSNLLSELEIPTLWLIAEKDREAPPVETVRFLSQQAADTKPVSVKLFANTDHGLLYYHVIDGQRQPTHYPKQLFQIKAKWISQSFPTLPLPDRVSDYPDWNWCLDSSD